MRPATIAFILCLLACASFAQERPDPNSPDFDPVAAMQRFDPNWQPPKVSQEDLAKFALGSRERPVRTQGPQGQHDYLSRLVCDSGKTPKFERIGNSGKSPYGFWMDAYEVKCGWAAKSTVHMDLYHPRYVEQEPVPGFTIRK